MRHRILAELKRNNAASLYNIHNDSLEASFSLRRRKKAECRRAHPSKEKSVSEKQAKSAERGRAIVSF